MKKKKQPAKSWMCQGQEKRNEKNVKRLEIDKQQKILVKYMKYEAWNPKHC